MEQGASPSSRNINGDRRAFWLTFALGALMTPAAFGFAILTQIDLLSSVRPSAASIAAGVAATGPLALMLFWFMRSSWRPIVDFRASQLKFFSEIGFRLTPLRVVLLSLAAGVGEELLFRGVLQTVLANHFSIAAAIVASNLMFGLLHARTAIYAVAAGVVGAYLGVLYWLTGSLAAPMAAHALYDIIAFEWTRRVLSQRRSAG